MHLAPNLIDMSMAARSVPERLVAARHVPFGGPAKFGPSGVIGEPTLASAETGARLRESIGATLGQGLADVATFSFA